MSIATQSATATSTTTAPGKKNPPTATFGFLTTSLPTGLLTAMATGPTLALGAGPGSIILLGALLPFTMAAGTILAATGVGPRVRSTPILTTALPSLAGFAAVLAVVLALGVGGAAG